MRTDPQALARVWAIVDSDKARCIAAADHDSTDLYAAIQKWRRSNPAASPFTAMSSDLDEIESSDFLFWALSNPPSLSSDEALLTYGYLKGIATAVKFQGTPSPPPA